MNRREFLERSRATGLGLAAGVTILPAAQSIGATPANERLSLAVVGIRSRGHTLATTFAQRSDCHVAYLCDADGSLLESRAEAVTKAQGGKAPKCVKDFRKALDDRSVDALVIATPDHWHCLAALWALRAGKDVWVSAPLSHNPWEGRLLADAAAKTQRIVQVDMASRSAGYCQSAKQFIQEGKLGTIHLCRVIEQKGQSNFPRKPDSAPPEGLDWDAWNGPAPQSAYNVNYQNNWHGYWRYSGGDLAVEGIQQLDLARWLCGLEHPAAVYATGGRFDSDGANQTPDTLAAVFEFDKLLVTFNLTLYTPYMQRISPAIRNGDLFPYWPQTAARIEIYGTEGVMLIGPGGTGWQVFGRPRREQPAIIDQVYGKPVDADHVESFVQSVRTRQPSPADALAGHRSALWVHYANMSLRTGGQKLLVDPKTDQLTNSPEAMKFFRREYRKPWVIEG